jgi:predicted nucleotidyltransferase
MSLTPYPDLDGVLVEFRRSLQSILGGKLVGAYLQGSFAVGDADEHSDVDWIDLINRSWSRLRSEDCTWHRIPSIFRP